MLLTCVVNCVNLITGVFSFIIQNLEYKQHQFTTVSYEEYQVV